MGLFSVKLKILLNDWRMDNEGEIWMMKGKGWQMKDDGQIMTSHFAAYDPLLAKYKWINIIMYRLQYTAGLYMTLYDNVTPRGFWDNLEKEKK